MNRGHHRRGANDEEPSVLALYEGRRVRGRGMPYSISRTMSVPRAMPRSFEAHDWFPAQRSSASTMRRRSGFER